MKLHTIGQSVGCLLAWLTVGCSSPRPDLAPGAVVPRRQIVMPQGFDSQNIELQGVDPLIAPMKMATAPDGRVFVCEQRGRIRVIKNDVLLVTPLLDISANVDVNGDGGLQSLTLDPAFATNGKFYVYYHRKPSVAGGWPVGRVASYQTSTGNPDVANATVISQLDLNEIKGPNGERPGSHTQGTVAMGKDGMLYVALGTSDAADATLSATDHSAGKILRLRPSDLGAAPGNPFESSTNEIQKRVFAKGLRNPFNLAVQRTTGKMFFDDVGSNHVVSPSVRLPKNAYEETSRVLNPGSDPTWPVVLQDFGWPFTEGDGPGLVHVYANGLSNENSGGGDCAKTAGDFYDPVTAAFPSSYVGGYFFGDYCSGYIQWLPAANQIPTVDDGNPATFEYPSNVALPFVSNLGISLTDIEVSPQGSIYYLGRGTPQRDGSAIGYMGKIFTSGPVPTVKITTPVDGARFGTGGTNAVDVAIAVDATDTNGGVTQVEFFVNAASIGTITQAPYALTATGLPRGTHRLTAKATNTLGNAKTSDPVTITVDGPTATIITPTAASTYVAGQAVSYSGDGLTFDGVPITTAASFVWNVYLHHGSHVHLAATSIGKTGSFTPPTAVEKAANVFYGFYLTVTDALGVAHTARRDVVPVKPTISVASSTPGLTVKLDGSFQATPYSFQSVAGVIRHFEASQKQFLNGHWYEFTGWADGGTVYTRDINTPQTNTTYTANYRDATGLGTGLYVEYFSDGALGTRVGQTNEATVDSDWGLLPPPVTGVPADNFSVRWTGKVQPYFTETVSFYVDADGGVRLWVNGSQVIDSWTEAASERRVDVNLTGGTKYDIKLEYRDTTGSARVKLLWATSGVGKGVIPGSQLTPAQIVAPPPARDILFVVGTTTLTAADAAAKSRMETQLGLGVDVIVPASLTPALATAVGRKLVVVSESVTSTDVNTLLTAVAIPVATWEPAILDDLGMTGTVYGTDMGTVAAQTQISIVDAASPLAAGLTGAPTVTSVSSTFVFGIPGPGAKVIGRVVGSATQATIFTYDPGALMPVGTAPARRLGLFLSTTTASDFNATGWSLFDAGIKWAAGIGTTPPPAKTALFVVGNTTLATGDTALRNRLVALGYTVTTKQANAAVSGDATGQTLVLVSDTVTSSQVNTKFKTVAVPVLTCEPALLDDMGMTGLTNNTHYGTNTNQTKLTIIATGNALAAGLTGSPTVTTAGGSYLWGKPNANATVVARINGSSDRAAIFTYAKNTTMVSGTASEKRGAFFATSSVPTTFNASAWALFDAMVAWAATP